MKSLDDIKTENVYGGKIYTINIKEKKKTSSSKTNIYIKLFAGALIGFVNGFWGGGGGMICVPILLGFFRLSEKKAHATTLLIMLPLTISSLIVYAYNGNLLLFEALKIGVGVVAGGILGALLLKKISNIWLEIIFSLIIIAGGIKMLI